MPSRARNGFTLAISNADLLCLRRSASLIDRKRRQAHYHAGLAASVAAWEAYLEAVVREFLSEITKPLDSQFTAVHTLLAKKVEAELKKFNTPNAENARRLLYNSSGYDPINDWVWPQRSMGSFAVRTRIDEILHVRHSFAHGFTMPAYGWNVDPIGTVRLTASCVAMVTALFRHLVRATDKGLDTYIRTTYAGGKPWYR